MKRILALAFAVVMLVSSCACAERNVTVPDGYVQGDLLPVYRAIPRTEDTVSFYDRADPAWFNESGVAAYENTSRRGRFDLFTFNDEAQMNVDVGYIDYQEYDGEHYVIYGDDPNDRHDPFPRPSFSSEVGQMASTVRLYMLWGEDAPRMQMEKTELAFITLAKAQKMVEDLLQKLNVQDYELSFALDMTADRIHRLGEWEEKRRGEYFNGYDRYYDFSQAEAENEGYYLFYERRLNGVRADELDGDISLEAYVDTQGLVRFTLRDPYAVGDVYETPGKLLTAEEIFACFAKDNARREKDGFMQPEVTGAELMYVPMRAPDKQDGMVFTPAWYVTYTFVDGSPSDGWAWYGAIDGKLIADCYS